MILPHNKTNVLAMACKALRDLVPYHLSSVISSSAHSSPNTVLFSTVSQTFQVYSCPPEDLCSSCSVWILYWPTSSPPSTLHTDLLKSHLLNEIYSDHECQYCHLPHPQHLFPYLVIFFCFHSTYHFLIQCLICLFILLTLIVYSKLGICFVHCCIPCPRTVSGT